MKMKAHELCRICDRVQWGEVVRSGFGTWRHSECRPGSEAWRERYHETAYVTRTDVDMMLAGEWTAH